MSLSHENHSIDLHCKSMDWFLYDRDLHYERVKELLDYDKKWFAEYWIATSLHALSSGLEQPFSLCVSIVQSHVHRSATIFKTRIIN